MLSYFRLSYIQFKEVKFLWGLGAGDRIWDPGAGDQITQTTDKSYGALSNYDSPFNYQWKKRHNN